MTRWHQRWPVRNEDGAFLVLYALMAIALLMMVAIVVDLGHLRADRRLNRSTADAAATAGALDLESSAETACTTAWGYAIDNLGISGSPASPCTGFPACIPSTSLTSNTVSGTAGGYLIEITNPVVNGDPLLGAEAVGGDISQALNTNTDGIACNRLGVKITYTRTSFFAKVGGFKQNTTSVHSVALRVTDDNGIPLSLVIMEPTRCGTITSSGSGGIDVTGTASPNLVGGILAVSDATGVCSGGGTPPRVLDTGGNSHIAVTQPGHIFVARMTGPTCADPACDPSQIDTAAPLGDRGVYPAPEDPLIVPDRGLVDGRYNCRANYSSGGSDPNYRTAFKRGTSGAILAACNSTQVTSPESDFVNHLFREVTAVPGALEPVSPTVYPNVTYPTCNALNGATLAGPTRIDCALPNNFTLTVNGNLFINNSSIISPGSLIVNGNAVFSGGITLGTGNSLEVNGNAEFRTGEIRSSGAAVLTIRGSAAGTICSTTSFVLTPTSCVRASSSLANFVFLGPGVTAMRLNGGTVNMPATTIFGSGGPTATDTTGPILDIGGGGSLNWRAPTDGPFNRLLGWSDKVSDLGNNATWHQLAGGGGLNLEGIFFSPTAKVRMTGGSTITPLRAQFWAAALQQDGSGVFTMTPDGSFILVPVGTGSRLIR